MAVSDLMKFFQTWLLFLQCIINIIDQEQSGCDNRIRLDVNSYRDKGTSQRYLNLYGINEVNIYYWCFITIAYSDYKQI